MHNRLEITFGSSGLLVQQILNGAPFDLFLSADTQFPEKLKSAGKNYGNPKIYAYGKVVLWSLKKDVSKGLDLLQNPEINKIAIANPVLAPYGKNTVEALKKSGLYFKIENKIVWAENISQVAQFARKEKRTAFADSYRKKYSSWKQKEFSCHSERSKTQ